MDAEVLKFKGIPIVGNVQSFIDRLQEESFSLVETDQDRAILEGSFLDYDVEVTVIFTRRTKQVAKVCVRFPDSLTVEEVKANYKNMVELYKKKYVFHSEQIISPATEDAAGCSYTLFKFSETSEEPVIVVEITPFYPNKYIQVSYQNTPNTLKLQEERDDMDIEDI